MRPITTALFLLPVLLLGVASPGRCEFWPIKDFTAILEHPQLFDSPRGEADWYAAKDAAKEALKGLLGIDDPELERKEKLALEAWARLTQQYLREIAEAYDAAGFDPPAIDPIIERNGKETYGVYVVSPEDMHPYLLGMASDKLGIYSSGCLPLPLKQNLMLVNRSQFGVNPRQPTAADDQHAALAGFADKLPYGEAISRKILDLMAYEIPRDLGDETEFYATLAHELFHAVQDVHRRRYGWRDLCASPFDTHRWIVEGMADGVEYYLASKKFPGFMQRGNGWRQGARQYSEPLNSERPVLRNFQTTDEDDAQVYQTSSFWRYFIERSGSLEILARLLRTKPQESGKAGRIKWLDGFIKKGFNRWGLYHFWPEFITEFASYGGFRYRQFGKGKGNTRVESAIAGNKVWLHRVFETCWYMTLTPEEPVKKVRTFFMEGISAQCVIVSWKGFEGIHRTRMELLGPDLGVLDQMHVGYAYHYHEPSRRLSVCYQNPGPEDSVKPRCNARETMQTGPRMGQYAKTFKGEVEDLTGDGEVAIIISNVAAKPWETRNTGSLAKYDEPFFRFGLEETEGSANYGPPRPVPESQGDSPGRRPARSKGPQPDTFEPMLVQEYDTPTPDRKARPVKRYHIRPNPEKPTPLGFAGPFHGDVDRTIAGAPEANLVSSMVCRHAGLMGRETPIGNVVEASEQRLVIEVSADLCRCELPRMEECAVVDHFEGRLSLASGWRHQRRTSPRKLPTPGQTINDRRFEQNLMLLAAAAASGDPRLETHHWNAMDPDPYISHDKIASRPAGGGDGGSATVHERVECTCSCAELAELEEAMRGEDNAVDPVRAARCARVCDDEYLACPAE